MQVFWDIELTWNFHVLENTANIIITVISIMYVLLKY